jgi:Trk K+ transport system NAD-binding subunit
MFYYKALAQGHRLTVFARSPGKLSADLQSNKAVEVITGEMKDRAALEQASHCRADAFVSFAGLSGGVQGTVS